MVRKSSAVRRVCNFTYWQKIKQHFESTIVAEKLTGIIMVYSACLSPCQIQRNKKSFFRTTEVDKRPERHPEPERKYKVMKISFYQRMRQKNLSKGDAKATVYNWRHLGHNQAHQEV